MGTLIAGSLLVVVGLAILVLPARFVRHEQQQYAAIVGRVAGRALTRTILIMVAAAVIASGTLLILRGSGLSR